ncbi:ADP-ribose pyrophosphatase YjhB (NUDIX family) [Anseongella ginsenosidimutans]|uniref:ADP-ribose pyrophosphatase YjhB (NUDIX family) n=1 Tax=Anseongella ginsenosidimutans TaxID=496056 RepID=A0A4R3KXG5_9SPHI|nr:NUDIX hydrolase [Anseongella ginsenosidimutans]QEC51364.1 NUDIX hydrolase [Anseongella ginsenosidimutans]TCS89934.1 ADP-ribose pyrophosphatase YjhB (NUDIX family) [Anseongella ginsenosidimutans]
MLRYSGQQRLLLAADCIIFGFDGRDIKLLLIQRGFKPALGKWSLMGGFVRKEESADEAANRILRQLTGLEGVYLEQLHTFSVPDRDPVERTVSVTYFALIDINKYQQQLSDEYHAEWFHLNDIPELIFDHRQMVDVARKRVQYKATLHPLLFELLPEKFTIPQLMHLYEGIYDTTFDKRNFSRKLLSTGLLIKQNEKDKSGSRKGAFYYVLDRQRYARSQQSFLHFIPNPDHLLRNGQASSLVKERKS